MTSLCIILFLAVTALWFFTNEYPVLMGIYVPACAVRRVYFKVIVTVSMLLAVFLSRNADIAPALTSAFSRGGMDCQSVFIVLMSALITLAVLKMFSVTGSVLYAVSGAMWAYLTVQGISVSFMQAMPLLIAPAMAFVLALLLRWSCRITIDRRHIHLITLSHYMRIAVIVCLVLTAAAIGFNFSGGLLAGADIISGRLAGVWPVLLVTGIAVTALESLMREESDRHASRYSDFSIYTVLSAGIAVIIVLMLFSFKASAGLLGMSPIPLSLSSLVFAAVAGCEVGQGSRLIESDEYAREAIALVMTPLGSLLVAYLIFYISGSTDEHMVDFTVMAAAILVLIALAFIGYSRKIRRQRAATEKLVYVQQQQIYENSRALNDMELKVVLSENQALHNSIEMKKQEVMNVALSIVEQREYLESLDSLVTKLSKTDDEKERGELIAELGASLKQRLSYDRDVDSQYFYAQAESLHEDFNSKLNENFPFLTQQERRLATLLRLGFSSKYIATLMNITPKSVEISRYRLRQKLGLSKGDNLVNFIKSI